MRGESNQPFTHQEVPYKKIKQIAEKHGVEPDKLEKILRELE
jgi:DNA-binding IscR family transcriptional regulator